MLSRATAATPWGIEARPVQIEVDVHSGLPQVQIVGLADAAVRESRERVRAAIKNCGFDLDPKSIIINLAPADLRKEGNHLDLAIDAMNRAGPKARLKIAGTGPLQGELQKQIVGLGVEDKVTLLGFVSAEELIALYAGCRAAYYAPLNEDYGYVTIEAFLAHKPVITTHDAGGPNEFVIDGVNGFVTDPTPDALGTAMTRLHDDAGRAASMGDAGYARGRTITWSGVIERLVG